MSVRIKNTANDRSKAHLHRTAARFELEPSFGGQRIRLGESRVISDADYHRNKQVIDEWVAKGIVEILVVADSPLLLVDVEPPKVDKKIEPVTEPGPLETNFGRVNPETGKSAMAELAEGTPTPLAAVIETQTPLTVGEEVTVTETATPEEVLAEIAVPAVPAPVPTAEAPTENKKSGKKKLF